jgi:uncharacterized damage-inducible protein DinB
MVTANFLQSACGHLNEGARRIATCIDMLGHDDLWRDPNRELVSIGNLVLHLSGNLSQYVLRGLGGRDYTRARDTEFTSKPGTVGGQLVASLGATVDGACRVIAGLSEADLARRYDIQGYSLTGLEVVVHVVEHFSYHTGQITFATKLFTNRATDYYGGRDLNKQ